jgi:predicted DNA-binding transcriptional regulator YafY
MILSRIEQTPFARLFASLLHVPGKMMSQTGRLYRITQMVENRGPISFNDLAAELEVSRATLKRDLATLRNSFNAPLEFDRFAGGFRFGRQGLGPRFELPRMWFASDLSDSPAACATGSD